MEKIIEHNRSHYQLLMRLNKVQLISKIIDLETERDCLFMISLQTNNSSHPNFKELEDMLCHTYTLLREKETEIAALKNEKSDFERAYKENAKLKALFKQSIFHCNILIGAVFVLLFALIAVCINCYVIN